MFRSFIVRFDRRLIGFLRIIARPLARLALFVVFFWFGVLKVIGASPANPLVQNLLEHTLPFINFKTFIVGFGIFEMIIGILFLIPRAERLAIACLVPHLVATLLPLILLPSIVWSGWFIPTLEGQYIIKNVVIIALALSIAAGLHPWSEQTSQS